MNGRQPEARPSEPGPQHATPDASVRPSEAAPRHAGRDLTAGGAALSARVLQLSTTQGRVFGPVDWELPPRSHGAVLGVQGSGRSAFLLALSGRMRGLTGELQVGDIDGLAHPRQLRHRTAIGRITDLADLEPSLTVAEAVDEHALLEGIRPRAGRQVFAELQDAVGHVFEPARVVGELSALERTLLSAMLGCQRPAHHIVLDDVDDALTSDQLETVYHVLDILGGLGHYFIVSALSSSAVPHGASVVTLPPPETGDGLALAFGHLHPRRIAKES